MEISHVPPERALDWSSQSSDINAKERPWMGLEMIWLISQVSEINCSNLVSKLKKIALLTTAKEEISEKRFEYK